MPDEGFKASEIGKCVICERGLMHTRLPLAIKIKLERIGFDLNAIRRRAGLEMILTPALAVKIVSKEAFICEECAFEPNLSFGQLWEAVFKEGD